MVLDVNVPASEVKLICWFLQSPSQRSCAISVSGEEVEITSGSSALTVYVVMNITSPYSRPAPLAPSGTILKATLPAVTQVPELLITQTRPGRQALLKGRPGPLAPCEEIVTRILSLQDSGSLPSLSERQPPSKAASMRALPSVRPVTVKLPSAAVRTLALERMPRPLPHSPCR